MTQRFTEQHSSLYIYTYLYMYMLHGMLAADFQMVSLKYNDFDLTKY